jgi:hypothetical protein
MKPKTRSLGIFLLCLVCFPAPILTHAAQMQDYTGPLFPVDNAWRIPVDNLPIHPRSDAFISSIGANTNLHPDFGTYYNGQPMGIPYNIVSAGLPGTAMTFEYADESDPGPYPIPQNPLIEG